MKTIKDFSLGSLVWLIIFVADYIIELFQIDTSSTVVTMMGLKIVTKMTSKSLNSDFSISAKAVMIYIAFIIIWMVATAFFRKVKRTR